MTPTSQVQTFCIPPHQRPSNWTDNTMPWAGGRGVALELGDLNMTNKQTKSLIDR